MAKQAAFEPRQLAIGSTPQEQPQSKSVFGRAMVWPSSRGQGRPSPAFDHAGRTAGAGGSARARPKGATGRSPCRAHCRGQTPLGMAGAATSFVGKWPPGACRHRAAHRPTSDGPAGCWVALRTGRRARAAQVSTRGCGATARARHRLRLLHWLSMRRLGYSTPGWPSTLSPYHNELTRTHLAALGYLAGMAFYNCRNLTLTSLSGRGELNGNGRAWWQRLLDRSLLPGTG